MQKTIDIDLVLRSKLGNRMRYVPRGVVSWLRRLLHEDDVNQILWDTRDVSGVPWLSACVREMDCAPVQYGTELLPPADDGRRYTFVSNHPLGGIDGIVLGSILGERYGGRVRYLVNDLLMNLPGLAPLCVPVNKTGKQGRRLPQMIDDAFRSENNILMFPAGLCSRKHGGVVRDLPWSKTFVTKSVANRRDIVPVYFHGHNTDRFYRIANVCAAVHSPVNVAMLLLVDEMFRQRGQHTEVHFGAPIPYTAFDSTRTPKQWAQWVQERVYELRSKK